MQSHNHIIQKASFILYTVLLNNVLLNLPSSPPETEKSFLRIVHFCMRWALEVAAELTLLIPSWIAQYTSLSFPPMTSDTLVAWLPSSWQNSTASLLRSSVGSVVSVSLQHWNTEFNSWNLMYCAKVKRKQCKNTTVAFWVRKKVFRSII